MALLDEEIVEYWLNNQGFFCMRGIKLGNQEIDFLAVREIDGALECWHVEVTVSFRPIGYIGGGNSAKKRNKKETELGVKEYIQKKFSSPKKLETRRKILPDVDWKYVLVCAEVKHEIELEYFKYNGVRVYRYADVISELLNSPPNKNSNAGNIIEIIRYLQKQAEEAPGLGLSANGQAPEVGALSVWRETTGRDHQLIRQALALTIPLMLETSNAWSNTLEIIQIAQSIGWPETLLNLPSKEREEILRLEKNLSDKRTAADFGEGQIDLIEHYFKLVKPFREVLHSSVRSKEP